MHCLVVVPAVAGLLWRSSGNGSWLALPTAHALQAPRQCMRVAAALQPAAERTAPNVVALGTQHVRASVLDRLLLGVPWVSTAVRGQRQGRRSTRWDGPRWGGALRMHSLRQRSRGERAGGVQQGL